MNPTSKYHCFGLFRSIRIGVEYLHRFFVIPRNRFFNIYLHHYTGSDDDRAMHDHPWWSVSFCLWGNLVEHYVEFTREDHPHGFVGWIMDHRKICWLLPYVRRPQHTHRLELKSKHAWTLFITGPKVREWGFHCPQGWVHWEQFTSGPDGEHIGRGCD